MKIFANLALAVLTSTPLAGSVGLQTHVSSIGPVAKVLSILEKINSTIIAEETAQWELYDEETKTCAKKFKAISWLIQSEGQHIDDDEAIIDKEDGEISGIVLNLKRLYKEMREMEADLKQTIALHAKALADHTTEMKNLDETIAALDKAIGHLDNAKYTGLAQIKAATSVTNALGAMVNASLLSLADSDHLNALLQTANEENDGDQDDALAKASQPYEKPKYDTRTEYGGITAKLEELKDTAEAKQRDGKLSWAQTVVNHEELVRKARRKIASKLKEISDYRKSKGYHEEVESETEGDLARTKKDLEGDKETQKLTEQECIAAKEEFEENSKMRQEEVTALTNAHTEIGKAEEAPAMTNFLQEQSTVNHRAANTLQHRSSNTLQQRTSNTLQQRASNKQKSLDFRMVHLVRDLADKHKDEALLALSMRMANVVRRSSQEGIDPFKKIKDMIHNMINKLLDEQYEEAQDWALCNKEISENEFTKKDRTEALERVQAKLDKKNARLTSVTREIGVIRQGLVDLEQDFLVASTQRQKARDLYLKTLADDQNGVEAIRKGREYLKEFYDDKKSGEGSVEGSVDGANNAISLLDVIERDFNEAIEMAKSNEEQAVADHQAAENEYKKAKATNELSIKYLEQEKDKLFQDTFELANEKKSLEKMISTTEEYLMAMKKKCTQPTTTHQERVDKLNSELDGLKEALQTLEGETDMASFLQHEAIHRRSLRGALQY